MALRPKAFAGGPIAVGSPGFGVDGQPFTWNTTVPIQYHTDGGPLSKKPDGTVVIDNAAGVGRVASMFQVWQDVATATIAYTAAGPITGVPDGDVDSVAEFDTVSGSCNNGSQSPIVFDADGSIVEDLGMDTAVIGFSALCAGNSGGRIVSALVVMNGIFQDKEPESPDNPELSTNSFDETFIHEFGHFSGLDHSQINVRCLRKCSAAELEGLPIMFPIAVGPGKKTLSSDDVAWISRLYPEPGFAASYGTISGAILFSDGASQAQGVNVIARLVDDPATPQDESRSKAISVVSGFQFTANPGQDVVGNNAAGSGFGSRNPALIGHYELSVPRGNYTLEVESINAGFEGGSSVGPLDPPVPMPGRVPEFWNDVESAKDSPQAKTPIAVAADATVGNINIILNGTPPRFDKFETSEFASSVEAQGR
jgi:hypothetical protein